MTPASNSLVRRARTPVLLVLFALLVSGCIFRDRSEEYRRSGSIKSITLPEGVTSVPLEPLYPIPEVQVSQTGESSFYNLEDDGFEVPRPEPMSAEAEQSKIKIQKVGERRWIFAEAPTSQVWPLAQSFFSSYGIDIAQSVPATGLVQTDWVVFKSDESTKSQFQIRIEQGLRPDTTEVHVLQHQVPANAKELGSWPERSTNPEREAWFLDELANALAADIENRAASLLGQSVGGAVKAELFMDGAEPALRLRLSESRAWATVAHAMTRDGYLLWDEDSERTLYYVQFRDPAKKSNWFVRLFTFEPASAATETRYKIRDLLTHLAAKEEVRALFGDLPGVVFGEPLEKGLGYLVVLRPEGGDVIVRVRDHSGARLELADNKRMLAVIRRNLI
jgi:outer membrane protein assembly factor BamC